MVDKYCLREVLCTAVHFTPTESLHRGGRVGKKKGLGGPPGVRGGGGVSWCYRGRGELEPPRTVMPLLPLVPSRLPPPSPSSVKYFRLNPLQPRFLVCMRRRNESFDVAAVSKEVWLLSLFCNFSTKDKN